MIKKIILFWFTLFILFSCNSEKSNIDSKELGKEKESSDIIGIADKNNQDSLEDDEKNSNKLILILYYL